MSGSRAISNAIKGSFWLTFDTLFDTHEEKTT